MPDCTLCPIRPQGERFCHRGAETQRLEDRGTEGQRDGETDGRSDYPSVSPSLRPSVPPSLRPSVPLSPRLSVYDFCSWFKTSPSALKTLSARRSSAPPSNFTFKTPFGLKLADSFPARKLSRLSGSTRAFSPSLMARLSPTRSIEMIPRRSASRRTRAKLKRFSTGMGKRP